MRPFAWVALLALLIGGCAAPVPLKIVRDLQFNYPATKVSAVRIYKDPPVAEYEVIGEVRARVSASVTMEQIENSLKEKAARIGATGVVLVVKDLVTERKVQRPAVSSQQPVRTSGTRGGGGVATFPSRTSRTEEVTIRVREKEITGVVIRLNK